MHLVTTLRSFTFLIISSLVNNLISLDASCLLDLTFWAKKNKFIFSVFLVTCPISVVMLF